MGPFAVSVASAEVVGRFVTLTAPPGLEDVSARALDADGKEFESADLALP